MSAVYILEVDGVERELRGGSLSWEPVINGADVLSCTILSPNRSYVPALGDVVVLSEDGVDVFGGIVSDFDEEGPDGQPTSFMSAFRLSADAFNIYFQGIYITETFLAGTTIEEIATILVDNYLGDFGVTLDPDQATGSSLAADLVCDGVLLSDALGRLTTATGYFGRINPSEEFRLLTAGEEAAPINIVDGDGHHVGDIRVTRSREKSQPNIVIVKYGPPGPPIDIVDSFTGDGVEDTFTLSQPIVGPTPPSSSGLIAYHVVDISGGTETLGGLTSPAIWLYDPNTLTIVRQLGAVGNGVDFTVRYTAQFPQTVTAQTSPATPPVTRVYLYPSVTSASEAQEMADALLAQSQTDKLIVRYSTYELGIQPGQTQTITAADRGVNGSFLITEVHAENPPETQDVLRHVTAIQGTQFRGSPRDIYSDWLNTGGGPTSIVAPPIASPSPTVLVATLRLTHAEIVDLGTVFPIIVPAPGVGFANVPLFMWTSQDFVTGYTGSADWGLRYETEVTPLTTVHQFSTTFSGVNWTARAARTVGLITTDVENKALVVLSDNSGATPLTGGHADNILTLHLTYCIVDAI